MGSLIRCSYSDLHYSRFWNIVVPYGPSSRRRSRHGYSILRDIEERTGDVRAITPSTLYSSIHRLLENGLIEELAERPAEDDERRRYYRLTALGRRVAELEARRLERLLRAARTGGLLPKRT